MQFVTWTLRAFLAVVIVAGMAACTTLGLNYASLETDNKPKAWPALEGTALAAVTTDREVGKDLVERLIFGPVPVGLPSRVVERRIVNPNYANGTATLEEFTLAIGQFKQERKFNLAVAFPKNATGPVPLIINKTFCPNRVTFNENELSPALSSVQMCGDEADMEGFGGGAVKTIFGRYIGTPPSERIIARGYALASFYPSDLVADNARIGRSDLNSFPEGARGRPTGAVAAWISGYSAALDVLEADPRIDPARTAVMGHSRHGKSALVAGAFEPRIEAVIAHQAGTGGSAISRYKPGESVDAITASYPHWFDPEYANYDAEGPYTTPVDMHYLIALNAPKKVFLGNGRRDVWSDPNGSYRAALAADAAWKALGQTGLDQAGMTDFNPNAGLVYFMRAGGHGIVKEDWDAFLDFLDAAMPAE
ncbi:MAG: alpha/beta hydrolase [Pseudomonadota bacterium]